MTILEMKYAICLASGFALWSGAFLAEALQLAVNNRVAIQTAPLIEGPSWLPVHCKVIVDDSHVFDFIPLNAASKETLQKLVTLQAVPATVRIMKKSGEPETNKRDNDEPYVERAIQFCEQYDRDLHLVSNNCWSFAFDLLQSISRSQNEL